MILLFSGHPFELFHLPRLIYSGVFVCWHWKSYTKYTINVGLLEKDKKKLVCVCVCGPELASGSLWQVAGQSCGLFFVCARVCHCFCVYVCVSC